jgi:hypothetical protein
MFSGLLDLAIRWFLYAAVACSDTNGIRLFLWYVFTEEYYRSWNCSCLFKLQNFTRIDLKLAVVLFIRSDS